MSKLRNISEQLVGTFYKVLEQHSLELLVNQDEDIKRHIFHGK